MKNVLQINYQCITFQGLKKELLQLSMEVPSDLGDLMFKIMEESYSKESKRAKLLATLLTYTNTNINQRAANGMTALHYAIKVKKNGLCSPDG